MCGKASRGKTLPHRNGTSLDERKDITPWRGGLVVGRRTCDLVVAGSRPSRDAAA